MENANFKGQKGIQAMNYTRSKLRGIDPKRLNFAFFNLQFEMKDGFPATHSWTVPSLAKPIRMDAFVRRCLPHLSMKEIQRAICEGAFWVNRRVGKKGDRLFAGDLLALRGFQHLLAPHPLPAWDLKVPVLYEDDNVLVLDKPAGMAVHGFSGRATKTLANFLAAARPSLSAVGKSRWEPGLVHRLDRDTSGLILAAKDQDSFENLRIQVRSGSVKKKYWALVHGRAKNEGEIHFPLIHDPGDRRKMKAIIEEAGGRERPGRKQWEATTRFRCLGSQQGFSLLEIEMETGVTHQIRAHMEAIGHPLVGDPVYGRDRPDPFELGRQFLHAFYLGFHHPKTGEPVTIESPLPGELREVLDRLDISL